jgi:putative transposase
VSSPAQRREVVQQVIEQHDYSERRACALVGLNRRTFWRPVPPDADHEVWQRLRELAQERPRFGSPRLHVLLRREGLVQNHKRTERLYRAEGLSLRLKRRKKRPSHLRVVMPTPNGADESWAMDFVADALAHGRRIRMLTIIDAWNRECPHIEVDFSLTGVRVARVLEQLRQRGRRPNLIQVDNGPEFVSKALDAWAHEHGVKLQFNEGHFSLQNCRLALQHQANHDYVSLRTSKAFSSAGILSKSMLSKARRGEGVPKAGLDLIRRDGRCQLSQHRRADADGQTQMCFDDASGAWPPDRLLAMRKSATPHSQERTQMRSGIA